LSKHPVAHWPSRARYWAAFYGLDEVGRGLVLNGRSTEVSRGVHHAFWKMRAHECARLRHVLRAGWGGRARGLWGAIF